MFDFERLRAYQCSLKCIDLGVVATRRIPRGDRQLADQLKRSMSSIALNIAEGSGEFKPKEKARFYRIALRSATESAAAIQVAFRLEYLSKSEFEVIYEELAVVSKLLTKLIHSVLSRE